LEIHKGAKQIHGFQYEDNICERYNICKSTNYTSKYDGIYEGVTPVQIKCIKLNSSVDLGDYHRNITHSQDFLLIIGFWENEKTNIVKEIVLKIDHEKWNRMGYFSEYDAMKEELKSITNLVEDDEKWKSYMQKYRSLYNNDIIKLRFKRDHKKQKRIQCAINNLSLKKICKLFPVKKNQTEFISETLTNEFGNVLVEKITNTLFTCKCVIKKFKEDEMIIPNIKATNPAMAIKNAIRPIKKICQP
jgi:primase-polymerase (primpol)-like protein